MNDTYFIQMPIPANMYTAVCALLGGYNAPPSMSNIVKSSDPEPGLSPEQQDIVGNAMAEVFASDEPEVLDAAGWAWSPELHASTKNQTKDSLWRMKIGVTRPDPKPGFPLPEAGATSTTNSGTASEAPATVTTEDAGQVTEVADDDEFAAFRAAADKANDTDTAAAASVPARKWTDADLGSLCNQVATKLGDPAPIKELIARFMPEGVVAHSRNIPDESREEFAKAVEAKVGISFAG